MATAAASTSRVPSRRKPLAACLAAVFALVPGAVLAGTVRQVTNCLDDGSSGSLRWAASLAVSGDVIDLTNVTDTTQCSHNQDGFAQAIVVGSVITVAGGVTISGPNTTSSKALAVGGGATHRVFTSPGYLTINNLGVKYGKNATPFFNHVRGGCVYAYGGAKLTDVVMDHCTAYSNAAYVYAEGGAIGSYIGPITLVDSTISHSAATSSYSGDALGGAIFSLFNVSLTNSTVSGTATSAAGVAKGGGIASLQGNVALTHSSVTHSYATANGNARYASGGGIYARGKVTLNDYSETFLTGAYANGTTIGYTLGGAIFAAGGIALSDSDVILSAARTASAYGSAAGGGLFSYDYVTLDHSILVAGTAYAKGGLAAGGGICSGGTAGGTVKLYYSALAQEHAAGSPGRGGGIYSKSGVQAKYSTIATSRASNSGGIAVQAGTTYLRGVSLYGNYATDAFSALNAFAGGSSVVVIANSTISGNQVGSSSFGNAVYAKAHTTKFYNSTIAYNTGGDGPGVYVAAGNGGSTLGLYSTLMSSNSYTSGIQNDFAKSSLVAFTAGSSNNLIRNSFGGVPPGTLTGTCPLLLRLRSNGGPTVTHALASGSPAIDAGSNPSNFATDQRGGSKSATSPARVSGSIADIGSYEVQQDDIVFNSAFEGCP